MSMIRCDQCDRQVDTDVEETEQFACGEDDHFTVCEACAVKIQAEQDAEMQVAYSEFQVLSPEQRNLEQYRRDLVDAGRGHLLHPEER